MHIRLLAVLLAALLTLGEGTLQTRARTPEPAKAPEEAIAYIGQTGAELRQTLNGGEEPWIFHGEDGEIPLEERLGIFFTYAEYEDGSGGPGCFFAADMEKRLMYYVELWDDGREGQLWLTILYMNDDNYRALTEIGKEEAKG